MFSSGPASDDKGPIFFESGYGSGFYLDMPFNFRKQNFLT